MLDNIETQGEFCRIDFDYASLNCFFKWSSSKFQMGNYLPKILRRLFEVSWSNMHARDIRCWWTLLAVTLNAISQKKIIKRGAFIDLSENWNLRTTSMSHFYTSCKRQKTIGLLAFSEGIEMCFNDCISCSTSDSRPQIFNPLHCFYYLQILSKRQARKRNLSRGSLRSRNGT